MIAALIRWSIVNRFLVLLATVIVTAWGLWAVQRTPLDALPDLSDVQVIIRTPYPGQAPRIVENQVTYPLTTTMLSVPGAKVVRGYSFFGDSFVYVLFEDGTDPYWARSRVLEYLNQMQGRLPAAAKPALGPDATGVGWIYQYALVDRSGTMDAGQLRALQDWFLKYELKTVPNVAEVASVGGMVRQYQVLLDPDKLAAYNVSHGAVIDAIRNANQEAGGSVLELGEAEYVVRASGLLATLDDFRKIPLSATDAGVSVRLGDVARVQVGPEMRRGIGELDGEGEATGGVIVMRSGKNALETIEAVKAKIASLQASLPKGVEIVPTYDRSSLIERAVKNLSHKLIEEFIVVALVCGVFLFHLRSALVAIVTLPLGILASFIVMHYQGVNANIMSLGGIAIAIGAMVDAAVVMIENAHKHIEAWRHEHPGEDLKGEAHWRVIGDAAVEVGPALFFSLLIITLSFIPVFTLEAQEGRLFSPLAFTKTYAMAAAAGLSVTLIPVLMGYLIRGRIPDEKAQPAQPRADRDLPAAAGRGAALAEDHACCRAVLLLASTPGRQQHRRRVHAAAGRRRPALHAVGAAGPVGRQGGRAAAADRPPDQDRARGASVFGKAGRAETATDPAPLEMFETTIQFKPRSEWRPGMTQDKLVEELDRIVKVPGLANIWVPPIRNRIDMLATGIKSPVGVKVAGTDLAEIDRVAGEIEKVVKDVPGVSTALAERLTGGRYVDVNDRPRRRGALRPEHRRRAVASSPRRSAATTSARRSRACSASRSTCATRARFAIPWRSCASCPIVTERGARFVLSDVADIAITDGPPMLRSENARLSGWIYVDIRGRDLRSAVQDMQRAVAEKVKLPAGLLDLVVGAVRVPGARDREAQGGGAVHAGASSSCCCTSPSGASTKRC